MRQRFQAQPSKSNELTLAHKDFVIVPEAGPLRVADVHVGGLPDGGGSMDALMPNRAWPCDHFAVLCAADLA